MELELRDKIAIQAMHGMLSCQDFFNEICKLVNSKEEARRALAREAYLMADAMLERREQTED